MTRVAALLPLALCACAPSLVERRVDELREIVAEAQRRGAASCAPVELALSSVHLEFAQLELRQGDEPRAEKHLILAEPNGKAALRRTKDGDCAKPAVPARPEDASATGPRPTTSRPARVASAPRATKSAVR